MKALVSSAQIGAGICLVALVAAVGMLWLWQDAQRAGASHTEVIFALSPTSNVPVTQIFLAIDGPARTFYVRAESVDDATGLAGFDVNVLFDQAVMVPSTCNSVRPGSPGAGTDTCILPDGIHLGSTGRSVFCVDQNDPGNPAVQLATENRWRASVSCGTTGQTPLGPSCGDPVTDPLCLDGSGLLAEITLQAAPGAVPGNFSLENESLLIDTTADANVIPTLNHSPTIVIANCGDMDADGFVTVGDILTVVRAFGSVPGSGHWNPDADLNKDGSVTIQDILLSVAQFGLLC